MTLNELCTNTTKFGALSIPAGRVEIAWTIDEESSDFALSGPNEAVPRSGLQHVEASAPA
jgi:two-component sensor histidine kinase